ncbi:transcription elongation factor Spt5 [Sulfolobales archaeon HS-7]|nr:transcription elongation factor Spt5 [Sulfolobales archaeon HS-7]
MGELLERTKASNFYAIKVTAGQEINVALMIEERAKLQGEVNIYSVIIPPNLKGYVIVEATGLHVIKPIIAGIRYVKGLVPGMLTDADISQFLEKKTVQHGYKAGDMVEIIAGPFKGMEAQVVRVETSKDEVMLTVLESAYPLQVTVPTDYIRPSKKK